MPLISKIYNEKFEHDHETRMFMRLSELLEADLQQEEENSYLLGNAMINGADIDAIFIRPSSTFFIIEFKQGGQLGGGRKRQMEIERKGDDGRQASYKSLRASPKLQKES